MRILALRVGLTVASALSALVVAFYLLGFLMFLYLPLAYNRAGWLAYGIVGLLQVGNVYFWYRFIRWLWRRPMPSSSSGSGLGEGG